MSGNSESNLALMFRDNNLKIFNTVSFSLPYSSTIHELLFTGIQIAKDPSFMIIQLKDDEKLAFLELESAFVNEIDDEFKIQVIQRVSFSLIKDIYSMVDCDTQSMFIYRFLVCVTFRYKRHWILLTTRPNQRTEAYQVTSVIARLKYWIKALVLMEIRTREPRNHSKTSILIVAMTNEDINQVLKVVKSDILTPI